MGRLMSKFVPPYRVLKPRGYVFQYMYANNYRCYHKDFGPNDSIWIWVKGDDFEVLDLHGKSGWLVNCLVKNRKKIPGLVKWNSFSILMNTENGKCWHYGDAERYWWVKMENRLYERAKKYGDEALRAFFQKWRTIHIKVEIVEEILSLYDDGLIELREEELPTE